MKCQKCDAVIPDGELFCKECGAEVQLVPDYNSIDYMMRYQQSLAEQEKEYDKKAERKMRRKYKKKKKKKHIGLIVTGVLILAVILACLVVYYIWHMNNNSYEYQYAKAIESYEMQEYESAGAYVERALYLKPDDMAAELLSVEILIDSGNEDLAMEALKAFIYNHPESDQGYKRLIGIYEERQDTDAIKELMDNCQQESIREQFASYICKEPYFVTAEGTYKYKVKVEVASDSGTVYYTTDGSAPDNLSQIYTEPIELSEGETVVSIIACNEKEIYSDVMTRIFTVKLPTPDSPQVTPDSGVYEKGSKITVTVPEGCTAYYVFDAVADDGGNLYTEPVSMLNGEHIFSVVLVDQNGKQSYPTTVAYVAE